ncbi:MAG: hypothetical protein R8G66_34175 [Cytophagales bacterium]|nr:hypothetical protein [Cytophagales bacterium]
MNTRQKKKLALFNKFSKNLAFVRNYPGVSIQSKDDNYSSADSEYLCPLSLKLFNQEGLNDIYTDHLTLEHSPPNSLKGHVVALTAKDSNSKGGHLLDHKLRTFVEVREFTMGVTPMKTKFFFDDTIGIPVEISTKSNPTFHFRPPSMHPGAKKLVEYFSVEGNSINFKVNIPNPKADISLLRVAYLIAFGTLGYSFLLGKSIPQLRDQINSPEKKIVNDIPLFYEGFPDELLGVNIITKPFEIRSLLVVFDLELNEKHRFGVVLPGPDSYGLKAYQEFNKYRKNYINFNARNLSKEVDITNPDHAMKFFSIWQEVFEGKQ